MGVRKILIVVVVIILFIAIWFIQPFSQLKYDFNHQVSTLGNASYPDEGIFTYEDIQKLPGPIQKYFISCGYIGKHKMNYMKIAFKNVDFLTGKNGKKLKIDYTQYNFVKEPIRLAFIDSSLFGIPFQGFDSYQDGVGRIKGVIAKAFTLFNQTGPEMDKASLVTFLSESLFAPNVALQDYIKWKSIDGTHVEATIAYRGISTSGVFSFNELGEMTSFETNDREAVDFNGNRRKVKWSAICSAYVEKNGIKQPTILQAVWHYPEGNMIYFDAQKDFSMEYK